MVERLRIAILTHSTGPGGGVAHALALGEALCAAGHEAIVHAPDPGGRGFFRDARCPVVSVAARPDPASDIEIVRARIAAYLAHFSTPAACDFDVFHAQCGIGGNALATLTRRRLIPAFVRTVHRIDAFADPGLDQLQDRAIFDAGRVLAVSEPCAARLAADYGARADVVGSGVDPVEFTARPGAGDGDLRRRLGLGEGPVFLWVGGFEARRNALATVEAFARVRGVRPEAQLVLAGDGPLLDHAGSEARCCAALERAGLEVGPGRAVVRTGVLAQADMPALYRLADALLHPAPREGLGLPVLEAMASGTPVIAAGPPPSTGDLGPGEALLVDPEDPAAVAAAMGASLEPGRRRALAAAGIAVARRHGWAACAARHLPAYAALARGPAPSTHAATGSAAWNTTWLPGDA